LCLRNEKSASRAYPIPFQYLYTLRRIDSGEIMKRVLVCSLAAHAFEKLLELTVTGRESQAAD